MMFTKELYLKRNKNLKTVFSLKQYNNCGQQNAHNNHFNYLVTWITGTLSLSVHSKLEKKSSFISKVFVVFFL